MPPEGADPADKCPVDPKTREKWLEAAKAKRQQTPAHPPPPPPVSAPSPPTPQIPSRYSLDSGTWQPLATPSTTPPHPPRKQQNPRLSTAREISTIPRALQLQRDEELARLNSAERAALPSPPSSSSRIATPANNELDTGHDKDSGNWVYPSQEMFFAAMRRKGHAAEAADMASVVPIHNAVNEKAWQEIKQWEAGRGSEACGGPKLVSFAGDSKALTPRARWKGWMGYAAPFDRHDWVVDRCGVHVGYVIDFYAGKETPGLVAGGKGLNFYLDVRPKLDSWEGVKMRALKVFGA
ncbi:hypothetical protein LTR36_005059 [Oleoguttula mirabilis]|uniref:Holocytochrome c-type synthase n=1 Tax=Oleoguttula mirabilis TaxID=1507867 RepID=A0AAV9JVN5_9PEZI|nr:hypothetical protein LTR36_005059 [Oleoguttula mirabilis]